MELLSPAGSFEALRAAVQNGADAVYLGMKSFGARASAKNFDNEELKSAIDYAHERGVKIYVTLNTLIDDDEMGDYCASVRVCAALGVDALIVADVGAAAVIKTVCPSMAIHASTQMTAHSAQDVEYLINKGFSRVVLSRELSKDEIRLIYEKTRAPLEIFVHGALCICYSGRCLLSSFIGGRSGNRGRCAQPCRQKYTMNNREGYFLSPRDLCLLSELKELQDAGAASLKIEGRMKSSEYVASVTAAYRDYMDNPRPVAKADEERLKRVFVRGDGFTKGFFGTSSTKDIMNTRISNDNITARADKTLIKELAATYREGEENKKVDITAVCTITKDAPSRLTFCDGVHTVSVEGAAAQTAINKPLTRDALYERLAKTGNTVYSLKSLEAHIDEGVTVAAKDINALRRDCAQKLTEARIAVTKPEFFDMPRIEQKSAKQPFYVAAQVASVEAYKAAKGADRIYVALDTALSMGGAKYVVLPDIVSDVSDLEKKLRKLDCKEVIASTFSSIMLARKMGLRVNANYTLNIYNAYSAEAIDADAITISCEKTLAQADYIANHTSKPCEAVAYGYLPLMTLRARITETTAVLCDKTNAAFRVMAEGNVNKLYNSRPIFMADKMTALRASALSGIRLIFTGETPDRIKEIIKMYMGDIRAQKPSLFTRGYWCGKD